MYIKIDNVHNIERERLQKHNRETNYYAHTFMLCNKQKYKYSTTNTKN